MNTSAILFLCLITVSMGKNVMKKSENNELPNTGNSEKCNSGLSSAKIETDCQSGATSGYAFIQATLSCEKVSLCVVGDTHIFMTEEDCETACPLTKCHKGACHGNCKVMDIKHDVENECYFCYCEDIGLLE